jgi:hypothetical protein
MAEILRKNKINKSDQAAAFRHPKKVIIYQRFFKNVSKPSVGIAETTQKEVSRIAECDNVGKLNFYQ